MDEEFKESGENNMIMFFDVDIFMETSKAKRWCASKGGKRHNYLTKLIKLISRDFVNMTPRHLDNC